MISLIVGGHEILLWLLRGNWTKKTRNDRAIARLLNWLIFRHFALWLSDEWQLYYD